MSSSHILMVVQLPPPTNGLTEMNQTAVAALSTAPGAAVTVLPLRYNRQLGRQGRFEARKLGIWLRDIFALGRRLWRERPEVLYFTPSIRGFWPVVRDASLVAVMRLWPGRRLLHLHNYGLEAICQQRPWLRFAYRFLLGGAEVICLGAEQARDCTAVVPSARTHILPNGIARRSTPPPTRPFRPPAPDAPIRLLYLSNYHEDKGTLDLLQALNILRQTDFPLHAVLRGDELRLTRQQLLDDLNHDARAGCPCHAIIEIGGYVAGAEKSALYDAADIFVFPSRMAESAPVVLLEALRAGLPVVATAVGCVPQLLETGVLGRLVPPGHPGALAQAIRELAEDPAQRREMSAQALAAFTARYTLEHFATGLRRIVQST